MKTAYTILNEKKLGPRVLDWGLHGELMRRKWEVAKGSRYKNPKDLFMAHVNTLAKVLKAKPEVIRDMMDSKAGRHYADSLNDIILGNPTPANALKHPWIKSSYKNFISGYDPVEFAATVESVSFSKGDKVIFTGGGPDAGEDLEEMTDHRRNAEMQKAQKRINDFWDRSKGDQAKFTAQINLRTKKMTKVEKVMIWADALENENFHDEAEVAFKRLKELGVR